MEGEAWVRVGRGLEYELMLEGGKVMILWVGGV